MDLMVHKQIISPTSQNYIKSRINGVIQFMKYNWIIIWNNIFGDFHWLPLTTPFSLRRNAVTENGKSTKTSHILNQLSLSSTRLRLLTSADVKPSSTQKTVKGKDSDYNIIVHSLSGHTGRREGELRRKSLLKNCLEVYLDKNCLF